MKNLIFLLLFPAMAFALTEKQFSSFEADDSHLVGDACHEESYLRHCYKTEEKPCLEQVKKSYDGCIKFLKKSATAKVTYDAFQKKVVSCVFRDVGLQWKENAISRTPACALPKKEAL